MQAAIDAGADISLLPAMDEVCTAFVSQGRRAHDHLMTCPVPGVESRRHPHEPGEAEG